MLRGLALVGRNPLVVPTSDNRHSAAVDICLARSVWLVYVLVHQLANKLVSGCSCPLKRPAEPDLQEGYEFCPFGHPRPFRHPRGGGDPDNVGNKTTIGIRIDLRL